MVRARPPRLRLLVVLGTALLGAAGCTCGRSAALSGPALAKQVLTAAEASMLKSGPVRFGTGFRGFPAASAIHSSGTWDRVRQEGTLTLFLPGAGRTDVRVSGGVVREERPGHAPFVYPSSGGNPVAQAGDPAQVVGQLLGGHPSLVAAGVTNGQRHYTGEIDGATVSQTADLGPRIPPRIPWAVWVDGHGRLTRLERQIFTTPRPVTDWEVFSQPGG